VYRLFTAMITQWIQDQHSLNKLQIFSRAQKGFVQGQAGCMEHALLTMELTSHAQTHRKNLYMVQIDFSNAFGSGPHDLMMSNMRAMGIPTTVTELVRNIYTDNSSKISLMRGDTPFIPWASDTVQGCPFSPTLFNICLESFLRRIEKPDLLNLGYSVKPQDGGEIKTNAAAYADDLVLYTESHEDIRILIHHLEAFCKYAKARVYADKGVSISQIWAPIHHTEADMNTFYIQGETG
jgi:hypothetical protein